MRRIFGRTVIAALVLVVVAVAGLAIYGQVRYRNAKSRFAAEFGKPELAALTVPEIPNEGNAATWLVRGAAALDLDDADRAELARLAVLPPSEWTDDDSGAAEKILGRQQRGLELLQQAARCSRGSFGIDYSLGRDTPLPAYLEFLVASRLVILDARHALARGDAEALTTDLDTLAATLDALTADSLLISTQIAFAVDGGYLTLLRDVLASSPPEPGVLASFTRHLSRYDVRRSLRRGLRGEGSMILSLPPTDLMNGPDGTLLTRLRAILHTRTERLFVADLLDDYSDFSQGLDLTFPELQGYMDGDLVRGRFWSRHSFLFVHLEDSAKRLKGLESSYGLARAALHYATTGKQTELGLDPFTGKPAIATRLPDGGYSFTSPGAADLWLELIPTKGRNAATPPFSWPVPAL